MKTAARMFLGFALFGIVAGTIYFPFATPIERGGVFLLYLFAVANLFMVYLMLKAGDPEVEKRKAQEEGHDEAHFEVHLPPPSIWPFVISAGAGITCWGFIMKPLILIAGVIIILIGVAGWAGAFRPINRDLAAWGDLWRYNQYRNLAKIAEELKQEEAKKEQEAQAAPAARTQ